MKDYHHFWHFVDESAKDDQLYQGKFHIQSRDDKKEDDNVNDNDDDDHDGDSDSDND